MSYVIDRAAEDAIFAELSGLDVPVTAVSEERGEVPIAGGGPARVVIDPVDGSLNAKRGVPFSAVSIAVASGPHGRRGGRVGGRAGSCGPEAASRAWPGIGGRCGARERVWRETLSRLEPGAARDPRPGDRSPPLPRAAAALASSRHAGSALGSVALTLCHVAAGHLDAMISLRPVRSVDVAAAQLIVTECGGAVRLPGGDTLDLSMRSHVAAARDERRWSAGGGAPAGLSSARACAPSACAPGRRESLPE